MQGLKTSLLLAGLLALSTAHAQKAEVDAIEAQAKSDKAACEPMKGNAKDVCQAEAKAKEKCEDQADRTQQQACKAQAKANEKAQRAAAKPASKGG